MLKIRHVLIVLGMLLSPAASADVQVSIGIGLPHVSIGINVPVYPQLVVVPGYPVYYAPSLQANFFFYDGMYWVYQDDYWYASTWYNGPWWIVEPAAVPVFILRIPVRYYVQPPAYFIGWRSDAPPRWGDHWGRDWEQRRSGWDRWNRQATPAPAPLPVYQREYSGDRYPRQVEQQHEIQQQKYRYEPRDPVVRQHYQEQAAQKGPAQQEKQGSPEERGSKQRRDEDVQRPTPASPQQGRPEVRDQKPSPVPGLDQREQRDQQMQKGPAQQDKQGSPEERGSKQQDMQRSMPRQQDAPAAQRSQPQQRGGEDIQRPTPAPQQGRPEVRDQRQSPQPGLDQREQQMPRSQVQKERQRDKDSTSEPKPGQGQEQDRGRGRNEY
jgi:hypothetical protein